MLKALGKAIIYIIKKKTQERWLGFDPPPPIRGTRVPVWNPIKKSKSTF
jgi:hypothetical protein